MAFDRLTPCALHDMVFCYGFSQRLEYGATEQAPLAAALEYVFLVDFQLDSHVSIGGKLPAQVGGKTIGLAEIWVVATHRQRRTDCHEASAQAAAYVALQRSRRIIKQSDVRIANLSI